MEHVATLLKITLTANCCKLFLTVWVFPSLYIILPLSVYLVLDYGFLTGYKLILLIVKSFCC